MTLYLLSIFFNCMYHHNEYKNKYKYSILQVKIKNNIVMCMKTSSSVRLMIGIDNN